MIDSRELRIGNYIYDDNNLASKILGFSPFSHSVRCDEPEGCEILLKVQGSIHDCLMCESLKANPIPLSVEWLESFSFEPKRKTEYYHYYKLPSIDYEIRYCIKDFPDFSKKGSFYCKTLKLAIHSVHQLQNLIYATHGTELTLKP